MALSLVRGYDLLSTWRNLFLIAGEVTIAREYLYPTAGNEGHIKLQSPARIRTRGRDIKDLINLYTSHIMDRPDKTLKDFANCLIVYD